MSIPITIPRLGWNMQEGIFVEWLKADGDAVKSGDAVFRLEGEKATEDIEILDTGTLHIPANGPKTGDKLVVGAVIGYLLQPGEVLPSSEEAGDVNPVLVPPENRGQKTEIRGQKTEGGEQRTEDGEQRTEDGGQRTEDRGQKSLHAITPRARRLAARLEVDVGQLRGSGRNGRIRERDVIAIAPTQAAAAVSPTTTRKAIAARMLESRATTAPVTLTSLVDATNLVNLRNQFKAANTQPIPSYTDILVKLVAVALQKHPLLAARWTEAGIVPASRIDIGIAVDVDSGLLVPVVADVPALGLRQVATCTRELIERARSGELSSRDMQGGCFTITNLGAFGIDAFTPIINPPECAILGVGRIERRPVMDGDRVIGREQVTLSLTFDHRIVDGAPAARFLQTLAACIENPAPWVTS